MEKDFLAEDLNAFQFDQINQIAFSFFVKENGS